MLTPIAAKCFPGRESGCCAHACSSEVFPEEKVGALRSCLEQRSVSQGESWGVAFTHAAAKCFPGRKSRRYAHAYSSEVFPRERVGALRSCLFTPVAVKCFLGKESGRCAHACNTVFSREGES